MPLPPYLQVADLPGRLEQSSLPGKQTHKKGGDMPIMDVRYQAGGLDEATKAKLATLLTECLSAWKAGPVRAGGRAFAWVLFNELPRGDWWVGGATARGLRLSARTLSSCTSPSPRAT